MSKRNPQQGSTDNGSDETEVKAKPVNPFIQGMVTMKLPEGMGSCISLSGFVLEADEDGCVTVPLDSKSVMESHGLTVWQD